MPVISIFSGTFCKEEPIISSIHKAAGKELVADKDVVAEASRLSGIAEAKIDKAFSEIAKELGRRVAQGWTDSEIAQELARRLMPNWTDPQIAQTLLDWVGQGRTDSEIAQALRRLAQDLTDSETIRELKQGAAHGRIDPEIAQELKRMEAKVREDVKSIFAQLDLENHVQATLYALQEGLTSLENREDP